MADCTTVTGGAKWGRKGVKRRWGMGENGGGVCTILDKRGKRKKISLNSEGQNWRERLNMELLARPLLRIRYGRKSGTWFSFPLLTVFSLQSDSLAPPFASLRLGARPSLLLGLSWPGLRYGTLPLLTALCARKAVPPRRGCLRQSTALLPRSLVDGTLRPQSRAAPTGLPAAIYRAASRRLGSGFRFLPPFPHPSPHGSLPWLPDLRSFTWKS